MSHEIRTPMNGVIGMVDLLLGTDLTATQRDFAETARASGSALLHLLTDILDFSKIEAGKLVLEQVDFDLADVLEECGDLLALRAHEKRLEFTCAAAADVPRWLRGDPARLRQVLLNLTGNAIKFTPRGEVVVEATLLEATATDVQVRFTVRDTGIGIPAEKQAMLFQKFSQVDASTTRHFGGTGLGLAIAKELASLMGGEIGVQSVPNEGAEFWFTARFARAAQPAPPPAVAALRGIRLLVVDDHAPTRAAVAGQLRAWELRVTEAPDGPTALALLAAAAAAGDPFHTAIVDLEMPGLDGLGVARAIQAEAALRPVRLVLLTALGWTGDRQQAAELGCVACVAKPVRRSALLQSLSPGAEFHPVPVRPPGTPTPAADGRPAGGETAGSNLARAGFRILLAEDNPTNQKVALRILEKLGISAEAVSNGQQALQALSVTPYDAVLMDVQMPELDGLAATRKVREPGSAVLNRDIPIIAMTANAMVGDREKCLAAGMNDYISKPVSPQRLTEVLEQWLKQPLTALSVPEPPAPTPVGPVVFDRAGLLKRLLDDAELARVIVTGFLDDIPQQIEALRRSIAAGDAAGVQFQAHSIKGASASVGANALRAVAAELEMAAKESQLATATDRLGQIEAQFERLKATIAEEMPG